MEPKIDSVFLFETTLKELLKDKGFQLPSQFTREALLAASQMLEWLSSDRAAARHSLFPLISALEECIRGLGLDKRVGQSRMWGKFHATRTSKAFITSWVGVMNHSLEKKLASPLFYQHVTDVVFKKLVKRHTPTDSDKPSLKPATVPDLTYEEANALYYTAGYVVRAVQKKLSKKAKGDGVSDKHSLDKELNLCLIELTEDDNFDAPSDWTEEVNRGGLYFVSNTTYRIFRSMEMTIRQDLTQQAAPSISAGFKDDTVKKISEHDDVLFHWSMVSAEWDEEVSKKLLMMIVELWVTVRGFAFTRSWMEGWRSARGMDTTRDGFFRSSFFLRESLNLRGITL